MWKQSRQHSVKMEETLNFYKNKRILITGNTGFKGSWLTYILLLSGAKIVGFAQKPPTMPNLFTISGISDSKLHQITADIRELEQVYSAFKEHQPEIVFHLAAQPIVRKSYSDPVATYSTNVMGAVNVCEAIRLTPSVRSFLNVTTDKVYKNMEWEYGYREDDPLDGFDPYSNSKSCSELVTHSYKDSFFQDGLVAVSTARAGNVIGGGDFSSDRIIPDCVRKVMEGKESGKDVVIGVRNPYSIRPYQHVLEPLFMYLVIAMKQYENPSFSGYYNIGPDDIDCVPTMELVTMFCNEWNKRKDTSLPKLSWEDRVELNAPHESDLLKLNCSRVKSRFGWRPRWHIDKAIEETVRWTKIWISDGDVRAEMDREIKEYINEGGLQK